MRLLPGRPDHAGGGSAERHAEADRPADHRCDVREYLPLRHIPAHPGSDQASGGAGRMITVENLSRRSILRGIGIGSGLVLGFRVGFRSFPAGAVARQMLEEAAARVWNVDPASCHAQNHAIVHEPTGRRLGFGELVKVAADLPLPSADHLQLRFKPASARRYVGKPVPIVDLADIVRGRATYGIDVVAPGMKHASIERCPVYGGRGRSFGSKDALAVPGVEK